MDIQVSSNFERLLFEIHDRDGMAVRRHMQSLAQSGAFAIPPEPLARLRDEFRAEAVPEPEVVSEIAAVWREAGYLLDPHTAVGTRAARTLLRDDPRTPVVALATAHPAKFPDAVEEACGVRPALPPHLADLMGRPERFTVVPNDPAAVERHVRAHSRAVRGEAA